MENLHDIISTLRRDLSLDYPDLVLSETGVREALRLPSWISFEDFVCNPPMATHIKNMLQENILICVRLK